MKTKKNYSIPAFKIRCSAIGHIMTNAKGSVTEKQFLEIDNLKSKDKLTEKQTERLNELTYKRDNPELSETAKSYCRDWLKSKLYKRKLEFTSKYTDKGLIMEDESIDFVGEMLGIGLLFKNENKAEDDFMTGTNDIDVPNLVIDIKNSWSWETFPTFENKIPNIMYYWQLQGYMNLYKKPKGKLIYVLSDTPQHLIEREARNYCYYNGYGELDMETYNEFHRKLTYKDVPDELKIKIYDIERNDQDIQAIKDRVMLCGKYINHLIESL